VEDGGFDNAKEKKSLTKKNPERQKGGKKGIFQKKEKVISQEKG